MPTNSTIETLQTQVDQVKIDLDLLKEETSESLKKAKAEAAADKLKSAKEEISKKLEALKGLTDANSKADVVRLESMLKTLETSDSQLETLKIAVESKKETIDSVEDKNSDQEEKEEQKGWLKRQREGVTSKEERKENTLTNVGRVAMGVGAAALVYKGIKWLFTRNKEKDKTGEQPEEKKEKKSRWKKALLWAGIGTGGILVWKNWDKIKGWFSGLFDNKETPPDGPKLPNSFEGLTPEQKEKYENTSEEIDTFTKENIDLSTVVEFSEDDKVSKASIIFGLDKHSKNLQNFYTNDTLDYISGETTDGPIDNIMNRGKDKMGDILSPFLSRLESFKPFTSEFISKPAETLDKWLQGGKPEERRRILSLFYREYMNIINYSVEKKKLLEEKLAKEEVMTKERINETPTEKEQEAIQDLLDSDQRKKGKLESFFKQHQLMDLPSLCKDYGIETKEVSGDTKELLQDLQEEKDNVLQKEDNGETVFSRAETDFVDGGLQEDTIDDIDNTCEDLLDIEFGNGNKSLFTAYTHLITDIFGDNKELAESFMEKTKIKEVAEEFKTKLEGYRAKLKAGNFTPKDLQDLKTQTDVYLNAKKHYEVSIKNIDYMSDGSNINRGKVLSLPLDAAKDIAKAWKGETNSRRERIGYGLGGCYVAGQTLYIGSKLVAGQTILGKGVKIVTYGVGKTGIEIGKLPITLTEKGLKLLTGRTHLTSWGWSRYIKNAEHLNKLEKTDLLKYAFLNGEMSESGVVSVAKKLEMESISGGRISTIDEILSKRGLRDAKQIELFKKYRNNKGLRNLLVKKGAINNLKISDKIKYSIKDKALKLKVEFNMSEFEQLGKIDEFLGRSTHAGKSALVHGFLETTKSLQPEMIQEIFATQTFDNLTAGECKSIGKILGKNMNKFTSIDDFKAWQGFFVRNYKGVNATESFISNSMGKRGKLKAMTSVEQAKYIETAKLNTSFLDRRINWMKGNFKKSAETLKKLIKKSPYPQQVAETAKNLENMANVENEVYRAAQMAEEVGKGAWLSGKTSLMNQISPLLKEKAFLESLGKAKTPQAIKELFATKGMNTIPEELAQSLAKTKSTQKIIDTIEYVKNYDNLGKVMKILENPTMKYAGRVAGRVLGVGTVVLGGVFAYNTYQEGSEIKKTNTERGDIKQQESFYDLGLAVAGACAFVPGIGRVAGAAIIGLTTIGSVVKESVFETLDKYTKNYKDFLQDSPLLIKQHILTTILGQNKKDAAMGEYLARWLSSKNFKHLTEKTGSEAMKGLLYIEEWKNNSLAMFDMDKEEDKKYLASLNPPKTAEDVGKAIDEVDARVNKRYEYLKQKLGTIKGKDSKLILIPIPGTLGVLPKKIEYEDGKEYLDVQKVLTNDIVFKGKGMDTINQLLLQSSYAVDNPEMFDSPEKNEVQKKQLKEKLDSDSSLFTKLEGIYAKDPKSLLYMYRYTNDYENHINTFGTEDTSYNDIINHIEYFTDYMNYKGLMTGVDIFQSSQGFAEVDFIRCREFFLNCDFKQSLTSKEIYGETPKLQNILYRIATEVIGAKINNNSGEEIQKVFSEANEKTYGIYFDDGDSKRLSINGNRLSDTEYSESNNVTIEKIKQDIQEKINNNNLIDIGTGDEILNKEIGSKYIRIIDEELARK